MLSVLAGTRADYVPEAACEKASFTPYWRATVEGDGERLTLSAEMSGKWLRLSRALTHASCQGLSLRGARLLDAESPHFTWKRLYVGTSRCTSSSALLQVS